MKVSEFNTIIEKAKVRKDGVYTYRDYVYGVKNNRFVAYADPFGEVFSIQYGWSVTIGRCQRWDRKNQIKQFIKS